MFVTLIPSFFDGVMMPVEMHAEHVLVRLTEDGLSEQILSVSTISPPRHAVLDFTNLSYVASIHLGQLLKLRQHQIANDRRLGLFGLRPEVRKLFQLTALEIIIEIHDTEADALASLS
jgi:anti-anti-sigma factor